MNRSKIIVVSLTLCILALGSFVTAPPVWSGPGEKKIDLNNPLEKTSPDRDDEKLKNKGKKKTGKKVVKKAGVAAAVGITTKKATSGLKKTVKDVVK